MMHNGGVEHFHLIKRDVVDKLSNTMYAWVQGQTDSEHFFALFLDKLTRRSATPSTTDIAICLEETFVDFLELMAKHKITVPAYFNLVVTDGKKMVGSRFVSQKGATPLSLHHSERGKFICEHGVPSLKKDSVHERGVILASEKLTHDPGDWKMVPEHHFVLVEENLDVHFKAIKT